MAGCGKETIHEVFFCIQNEKMKITNDAGSIPPAPVDRQGLASVAAARLRQMITEGELAPGMRLNERILCEQLAVSRTPLRESFKTLAVEGLVELLPNRGAIVAQMSIEDIEQTFEVMSALEGLSGQLACQRIGDAEIMEIRALHFEMLSAHARRDLPRYYRINQAIHNCINAAAGNAVLTSTYQQMNSRIQSLRFRSNFNQEKWDAAVREHGEMLAALEKRDGAGLRDILQQHLVAKRNAIINELAQAAREA
jgi:DNA-binding GntR family transcriptional regulator